MAETHWYKEAIFYEVHVKCFYDSTGDGVGDFAGLTQKLDYLQDLGITAIWLLPFFPSPLKDDGYDISDYTDVHPHYGKLKDFRQFLNEAHKRNIRVIIELVLNHTSDQHPWFQRARKASKNSSYRNYYVWSDTPDKYKEARIIFKDTETSNWAWDPIAKSYFWHRFYSHQPDLNFDHKEVHRELFRFISFWMKMGVDGVRLDAVPYLYEREGTICENLPETHEFLKSLRKFVDSNFEERMLLAEANQWPDDAAKYFGNGDECHMAFHFPAMPRLFMAIYLEDSFPIIEIMKQTPLIPPICQWAFFLRNHDELTLEMVTDEERDYMFRVYATDPQARLNLGIRRRLAPLLKNDRRKIELMNSLLFSLTGTPIIYYGDEIGMGDNIYLGDRNGVRTPMQWSSDRNAGFSRANPQQLYLPPIIDPEYHYETVNVEAQLSNPYSLLWWTKQLVMLRKRYKAFSYGTTDFLISDNRKVLIFFREFEEELILIVSNLSRFPQYVELDLSKYNGFSLIEMFSNQRFPKIGELPYFLTLGPYGYYWFLLESQPKQSRQEVLDQERERQVQEIIVREDGEKIFQPAMRKILETAIRRYLIKRQWFKPRLTVLDKVRIIDHVVINYEKIRAHLTFVEFTQEAGIPREILLYLAYYKGDEAAKRLQSFPENVVMKFKPLKKEEELEILYDVSMDEWAARMMRDLIVRQKRMKTERGEIKGISLPHVHELPTTALVGGESVPLHRNEHSILFPVEHVIIRLFWLIDEGMDRDVEMRLFLTQKTSFRKFFPLKGYVEFIKNGETKLALAEEIGAAHRESNAKHFALEVADRFLRAQSKEFEHPPDETLLPKCGIFALATKETPQKLTDLFHEQLEFSRLLGDMTSEFHTALASYREDPDFAPDATTLFSQRSLYQNLLSKLDEAAKKNSTVAAKRETLFNYLQNLLKGHIKAERIRYHGNYALDNLHYTGKEFLIASFEGDLSQRYQERRFKRTALVDIASMLFSFAETGHEAAHHFGQRGPVKETEVQNIPKWGALWGIWSGSLFLNAYLKSLAQPTFLPQTEKEIDFLLFIYLMENCLDNIVSGENTDVALSTLLYWLQFYENFQLF